MDFVEHIFLALAYFAVIGFLISGLDDFFFDSQFLIFLFRLKVQRDGIDTVTKAGRARPVGKDVAEMRSASATHDFGPGHSIA